MLMQLCQNQYLVKLTPVLLHFSLRALTSDSSWSSTLASRALPMDTSPLAVTELGSCLRNTTCSSCLYLLCLMVWCKESFYKGKWQVILCGKSLEERKLWQSHSDGSNIHGVCVCVSWGAYLSSPHLRVSLLLNPFLLNSSTWQQAGEQSPLSNILALNCKLKRFRLM